MPTLVVNSETISVRVSARQVELIKWEEWGRKAESRLKVPLMDIDRVVIVGRPSVTFPVFQRLLKNGIPCYLLTRRGRWLGALAPDNNLNGARRLLQYRLAHDENFKLKVARKLLAAKIRNSRRVLQRLSANRDESHLPEQRDADSALSLYADAVRRAETLEQIRGLEGSAAAKYFSRLRSFFPEHVPFPGRNRRPPKDPANALLSWTYTVLLGELDGAVRSHGLDSCIGFLHGLRHGTPALALDLLEPLRAPVCDLLVLNLLNHRILTENDFDLDAESGGFYLKEDSHKTFFTAYEGAMTRLFTPAKGQAHITFRGVLEAEVVTLLGLMDGGEEGEFFQMP
ncbi:MAG: CRISPR-associated endonuclease Cas1 [Acidobacteriota bacterium]